MEKFTKITVGFVLQDYEKNTDGKFVCTGQDFVAGDDVQYENADGETIAVPKHVYQPFNMTLVSGSQIAHVIRDAINRMKAKDTLTSGLDILKTLLKRLG